MSLLPTVTMTFLFTEIEGSTNLWEHHPQAMPDALARHNTLLHTAIETYNGALFKTVGDGICAAFASALDALSAAITAQRALVTESWIVPLRVRLALHSGVVDARDGDVGQPLNRIARLLATGHGGQVLLTRATTELVRDHLPPGVILRDLGEHRLRDLFRPEQIFQLIAPGLPADFPPLRSLAQHQTNLPIQLTPLIGREQDVAAACAILRRPSVRLLTITGSGGAGKTRLGLQVAAELLDTFVDGVYFVALAAITDPALVPTTIAQALGVRETGSSSPLELLQDYLRDKRLLLLLDNVEQVLEASPAIAVLLERAPQLKVLVTSRIVTHLYGEHEYVVPPLSLPDLKRLPSLERLTQYEAVRLFIERTQAAKADFTVTNENAPAIAEICVRLDGLPLAIELAAARIKILSPQALLPRLSNRLQLLSGGARNLPARQQTLRKTIDWSYELLDPQEQILFARLALFAGGCTLEAANAICNVTADPPVEMLDGLASLLNKSLLQQAEEAGGEVRFAMLETIREYAWEQLEARGETEALQQHHAAYYLALAEAAMLELEGPQQAGWLVRLDAEHDNMRAALQWLLDHQEVERCLRLAGALWRFWMMHGYHSEGRRWLETTLVLAARGGPIRPAEVLLQSETKHRAALALALNGAGGLAASQGDNLVARPLLEASLALYRELGDRTGIANLLGNLGNLALSQEDYALARTLLEESLALYRELGDKAGIANSLRMLGLLAPSQKDYVMGRVLLEESLALYHELEDSWNMAMVLNLLGNLNTDQGNYALARTLLEQSLALYHELGDRWGIAEALSSLGNLAANQGNYALARRLLEEGLVVWREVGDMRSIVAALEGFAKVASGQGQAERALWLAAAAATLRATNSVPLPPESQARLDRCLAPARQAVSEATRTAVWEAGRTITLEQAIAYALEPAPHPPEAPPAKVVYPAGLSSREVEVLRLVAQGLTDTQVAEQLVLSPRTVNAHLASIYGKLGVNSRTAATRFALDHGLA